MDGRLSLIHISLRELEDQCKVNLRFMYLMDHQAPSYRTFGYFVNEVLADSIEEIFQDINKKIFETEHVDLQDVYKRQATSNVTLEHVENKYFIGLRLAICFSL